MVLFIGVEYKSDDDKNTFRDFHVLNDELAGVLFIYNDNITQWKQGDYMPGGGNGFMRQHRSDGYSPTGKYPYIKSNNISLGIPIIGVPKSDESRQWSSEELLALNINTLVDVKCDGVTHKLKAQELVKLSIKNIKDTINKNNIKYVYWSVDNLGNLGYSIYSVSEEFKKLVNDEMNAMIDTLKNPSESKGNRVRQNELSEGEEIIGDEAPKPKGTIVERNFDVTPVNKLICEYAKRLQKSYFVSASGNIYTDREKASSPETKNIDECKQKSPIPTNPHKFFRGIPDSDELASDITNRVTDDEKKDAYYCEPKVAKGGGIPINIMYQHNKRAYISIVQ